VGKHAKVDWPKAQELFEVGGKSLTEIASIFGCQRDTISRRAKKEAWTDRAEIVRETAAERHDLIAREFVERNAQAILADHEDQFKVVRKLRKLVDKHADRLLADRLWIMEGKGEDAPAVTEDPAATLDKLTRAAERCEKIGRSLAGLNDAGWRSGTESSDGDSGAREARIRGALDELGKDGSAGGGRGNQGPLPH
jgi:hypothetical protein